MPKTGVIGLTKGFSAFIFPLEVLTSVKRTYPSVPVGKAVGIYPPLPLSHLDPSSLSLSPSLYLLSLLLLGYCVQSPDSQVFRATTSKCPDHESLQAQSVDSDMFRPPPDPRSKLFRVPFKAVLLAYRNPPVLLVVHDADMCLRVRSKYLD